MEVGLIECQTCKKKILGTKKILGNFFFKFFSLNLIILYTFELGFINLNFFIYKKLVRINLGIRIKKSQCEKKTDHNLGNVNKSLKNMNC